MLRHKRHWRWVKDRLALVFKKDKSDIKHDRRRLTVLTFHPNRKMSISLMCYCSKLNKSPQVIYGRESTRSFHQTAVVCSSSLLEAKLLQATFALTTSKFSAELLAVRLECGEFLPPGFYKEEECMARKRRRLRFSNWRSEHSSFFVLNQWSTLNQRAFVSLTSP